MFNHKKENKSFSSNYLIPRSCISYEKELGATDKSIAIFFPNQTFWTTLSKNFIIDNDKAKDYIIANVPLKIAMFRTPIKDSNGVFNNWANKSFLIKILDKLQKMYFLKIRIIKAKIINGNKLAKKLSELKATWKDIQNYLNKTQQEYHQYFQSFSKQTVSRNITKDLSDEQLTKLAQEYEINLENKEEKQRFRNWAIQYAV